MNLKFRNFITPILLISCFYGSAIFAAASLSDVIDVISALQSSQASSTATSSATVTPAAPVASVSADYAIVELTTNSINDLTVVSLKGLGDTTQESPAPSTYFTANWSDIPPAVQQLKADVGFVTFQINATTQEITSSASATPQPMNPLAIGAPYLIIATDTTGYTSTVISTTGNFAIKVMNQANVAAKKAKEATSTINLPYAHIQQLVIYAAAASTDNFAVVPNYVDKSVYPLIHNVLGGLTVEAQPVQVQVVETPPNKQAITFTQKGQTIVSIRNPQLNNIANRSYLALLLDGDGNYHATTFSAQNPLTIQLAPASAQPAAATTTPAQPTAVTTSAAQVNLLPQVIDVIAELNTVPASKTPTVQPAPAPTKPTTPTTAQPVPAPTPAPAPTKPAASQPSTTQTAYDAFKVTNGLGEGQPLHTLTTKLQSLLVMVGNVAYSFFDATTIHNKWTVEATNLDVSISLQSWVNGIQFALLAYDANGTLITNFNMTPAPQVELLKLYAFDNSTGALLLAEPLELANGTVLKDFVGYDSDQAQFVNPISTQTLFTIGLGYSGGVRMANTAYPGFLLVQLQNASLAPA